ncbi:MAG: gamma-glutamyltransferase [Alphaproteobacteria bacterium]
MQLGRARFGRDEVAGERGAVGAGNLRTAAAGARILAKGGNAVDAAIAAAFMAYVVEPASAGLGGHGRLTVHMSKLGKTIGIDHYIRAPGGATPAAYTEALRRSGHDTRRIKHTGHLSVGVFGTVAGICAAHERFATLPLPTLMEEAIGAAEVGPYIDREIQNAILGRVEDLEGFPRAREALLPGGRVPQVANGLVRGTDGWEGPGHRLDTSDLARTLKRVAHEGAAAIYTGSIAEAIDREMKANNGVLTAADLAGYQPSVFDEALYTYRDHTYTTCSDLLGPQFLNIMERFDVAAMDPDGTDYRHLVAEALALAFADTFHYPADPAAADAPRRGLAAKPYGQVQAARINMAKAMGRGGYGPGDPWPFEGRPRPAGTLAGGETAPLPGTTAVTVGDSDGNIASFITSLGSSFGSLVLVPDSGVFLGNAMQWFDPRPGLANSVAPGRMPVYGAPLMTVYRQGVPVGATAGAGGFRIPTCLFHAFLNRVDHGMAIQAALDHPRLHTEGQELVVDERLGEPVIGALMDRGHTVQVNQDSYLSWSFGRPNAVWRDRGGTWHAASDAKSGGSAAV